MNYTDDKPVRVITEEQALFRCPVCTKPVMAVVEIAVWIGGANVTTDAHDASRMGSLALDAEVEHASRVRNLRVLHDCRAVADSEEEEAGEG